MNIELSVKTCNLAGSSEKKTSAPHSKQQELFEEDVFVVFNRRDAGNAEDREHPYSPVILSGAKNLFVSRGEDHSPTAQDSGLLQKFP